MKRIEKIPLEDIDVTGWQIDGYTKADNKLKCQILNEFSPLVYVVYLTILSHKNSESITSFPSISLIAKECGISKSSVEKAIHSLVEGKYLLINSGKSNVNNNYYFPMEEFHKGHENDIEVAMAKRRPSLRKNNNFT